MPRTSSRPVRSGRGADAPARCVSDPRSRHLSFVRNSAYVPNGQMPPGSRHPSHSFVAPLEKEPTVAFKIFCSISPAGRSLFDVRQDPRTGCFRACEMSIEVVHIDEHTIDNPWKRRPPARLLADLPMAFRTLVVGGGRSEHDQSVTCLHLAVREPPVRPDETCRLSESKSVSKPFQSRDSLFVRNHRNDRWDFAAVCSTFRRYLAFLAGARRFRVMAAFPPADKSRQ
jgi:hypothetical protein